MSGVEMFGVWLLALSLPFVAAILLAFFWKAIGPYKCRSPRARRVNGALVLASVAVYCTVPTTHWPLRAAFLLSKPALESVALDLQSGKRFNGRLRVGLFAIQKAEIYDLNGKVCLWTDLHPSGKTGFTLCPPDDIPFNLWSNLELDRRWQYVSED
jgi:hypothetical protein